MRQKADPVAFATTLPPQTDSVVHRSHHEWADDEWMERRRATEPSAGPVSIYEVHLGSWRRVTEDGEERPLTYRELADELAAYVTDMGFTHVELLPVMEHPFGGSWGYQVTSQFAPTSRYGTPDDFRYFVDKMHAAGIGVLLDWVPAHFPRDDWALARFDGTALYEHSDPRRGAHPEWGTLIYNYGRHEVRNFLTASALFWPREYHADGIRVDAVASMLYLDYSRPEGAWVPNEFGGNEDLEAVEFLKGMNETLYRREPGIISAAEESTAWPGVSRPTYLGGLGFGFKWNMGWMHDTLEYFGYDPIYRAYHHHELTFSLVYAFSENFILPLSHDEVVHGKGSMLEKMAGDRWQKLANLRALYAYMWAHPGKKLLFMGNEIAQEAEWNYEQSLDWHLLERAEHAGIQSLVRDLNGVLREEPALYERDFTLGDVDLHLIGEGRHEELYGKLGAHVTKVDGVEGTVLRRLGARGALGLRRRRLQRMARGPRPDALARRLRRLGDLHPRGRRGHPLQVRDPHPVGRDAPEGRPGRLRHHAAAADRLGRPPLPPRVGRRRVDGAPPGDRAERRAGLDLRGPPRLLAPGHRGRRGAPAHLPRAGRRARRLRHRHGLHPRRADAGDGASRSAAPGGTR